MARQKSIPAVMLNIAAAAFSGLSVVGVLVGFSMHNRMPPQRERGTRLLAVSGSTLIVVVTATVVVALCGPPRPSGRNGLPTGDEARKHIALGKPAFDPPPAPVAVDAAK